MAIGLPSSSTPAAVGRRATSSEEPGPTAIAGMLSERVQAAQQLVDVSRVGSHVEYRVEVELRCRLRKQFTERRARVPRALGVLLDDSVGVVTRLSALDEGQQRALREQRAVGRVE